MGTFVLGVVLGMVLNNNRKAVLELIKVGYNKVKNTFKK